MAWLLPLERLAIDVLLSPVLPLGFFLLLAWWLR
jgi:hypothetical protein